MTAEENLTALVPPTVAAAAAFGYLLFLFAVAFWADQRAVAGRSVIDRSWVYALSIGVYCTAWTFFGSVGLAAKEGLWFLPIYLGPTLVMLAAPQVLAPLMEVAKALRSTSLSDLLSARFGHHAGVSRMVSLLLVVVTIPYVALQIKAITLAFTVISGGSGGERARTFWVVVVLALFAALFGTRRLDVTERHEGLVAAVAFESLVKLAAFLFLGVVVSAVLIGDQGPLTTGWLAAWAEVPKIDALGAGYGDWLAMTVLAAIAFLFLPRQFQVLVVENVRVGHLRTASWQFPLYLWLLNLFVLPVALLGKVVVGGEASPDAYVLTVPLALGAHALALLVFLGGISAATSMVIVESVALATMVSNDWIAPWWLRRGKTLRPRFLLWVRRGVIVAVVAAGYLFFLLAGGSHALVAIGLVSFVGVAQLAPPFLAAFLWRGVSSAGAIAGLVAGLLVWGYSAVVPLLVRSGSLPDTWLTAGPAGVAWLRPDALFGVSGMTPLTASLWWSWLINALVLVLVSLWRPPDAATSAAAYRFRRAAWRKLAHDGEEEESPAAGHTAWQAKARSDPLLATLERFVGADRLREALTHYRRERGLAMDAPLLVDEHFLAFAERLLAGAIGGVAARLVLEGVLGERAPAWDEVLALVDEARSVRARNEALEALDRLKDEFIAAVTHELRTPLTAIRTLAEILATDPQIDPKQRQRFYQTMVRESERLTRLVNQVLDLARLDEGRGQWRHEPVDLAGVVREVADTVRPVAEQRGGRVTVVLSAEPAIVLGDRDRLVQVVLNLAGNAVKFTPEPGGVVVLTVTRSPQGWAVWVDDNGPGVPVEERAAIFERFHQGTHTRRLAKGTGLGLAIAQRIVERLGGTIFVTDSPLGGARFGVMLPGNGEENEPRKEGADASKDSGSG